LPFELDLPLSRISTADLQREVIARGIVASIGQTTLWRWLNEDAIKPWTHRSWVFPRDPDFERKASPILDLYERRWRRKPLAENEFVISADEKPSIQCRRRKYATTPPAPGRPMRIEHEYFREGSWTYIAAWDVHRAKVFGRCVPKIGIVPFDQLVDSVMKRKPYRNAKRVFWIVDNASVHRGPASVDRFRTHWPNTVLLHTPNHASWLNQVEIYFSVVQRKVLTPNDFLALNDIPQRLADFERYYEVVARPFQWKFTRKNLKELLDRLAKYEPRLARVA
jgi:DDE superfamily endonuclease